MQEPKENERPKHSVINRSLGASGLRKLQGGNQKFQHMLGSCLRSRESWWIWCGDSLCVSGDQGSSFQWAPRDRKYRKDSLHSSRIQVLPCKLGTRGRLDVPYPKYLGPEVWNLRFFLLDFKIFQIHNETFYGMGPKSNGETHCISYTYNLKVIWHNIFTVPVFTVFLHRWSRWNFLFVVSHWCSKCFGFWNV